MNGAKYVVLGGGMVAGYAAKAMVEGGLKTGELAILSADDALPYERPPLSKGFLAGRDSEESIRINSQEFYRVHGIELRLQCEVSGLDAARKRLKLARSGEFGYDKLVLATGSVVRRLPVPGAEAGNVFYLRSLGDSMRLREAASTAKRAAVIGSSFIGMETTAVLAQGNVQTTMIMREARIWEQVFTPEMSRFFEGYYSQRGVKFVRQATVAAVEEKNGAAAGVRLDNGPTVDCDLVVAGVGVRPATDWLSGSPVALDHSPLGGVLVNALLETSLPGVYAAGDVANYPDEIFNKRRRAEHWDNAVAQGQHCAHTLLGRPAKFRHVPYFFSDVFDLSYEYWGDAAGADRAVHRGDVTSKSFSTWWLKQGRVVAAFAMNRPDEERETAPKWIEAAARVKADVLAKDSEAIGASEAA